MIEFLNDLRYKIGFCLVFSGVSLGMLLNYWYPVVKWSPVIMVLSILCLWGKSKIPEYKKWNGYFKMIATFMVMMVCYRIFYDGNRIEYANKVVAFQFYILSLCYVLNRNQKLALCNFIPVLILYTSILSVIFALMHYLGMFSWDFWHDQMSDERILEVFTANFAAFFNMMACLVSFKKGKWFVNTLFALMCVIDMYIIVCSGKRSFFVAVFAAIFFLLYKYNMIRKSLPYICIGVIALFLFSPTVRDQIMNMIDNTINGFSDVYGSKHVAYDENSSSSMRVYLQDRALEALSTEYSFLNYIFGAGYTAYFTDNPLLESYMDMGIAGFIFYVMIIVVMPLRMGMKIVKKDKCALLAFLVAIMNIVICITNNDPYIYLVYTPVCVLALYFSRICNVKKV